MNYQRVLPRDLFNESKLLKCLGQVTLLIHDGLAPIGLKVWQDYKGFKIERSIDGDLYCENLEFSINEMRLRFYTSLNSRDTYPLFMVDIVNDEIYDVLDCDGRFTSEFLNYCAEAAKLVEEVTQ